RAAAIALKLFPELDVRYPDLAQARHELLQDIRPFDNATPADLDVEAPTVHGTLTAEDKDWWPFQRLDLGYLTAVMKEHGGAYMGWERGLGKTIGGLALAESLGACSVLIVCPNTAKQAVWGDEMWRVKPLFDHVFVLPNAKRQREATLERAREAKRAGESVALILHYEALALMAGK